MNNHYIHAFQTFWKTYFPEQDLLSREQALALVGKQQQFTTLEEMRVYQGRVAFVYGSYELESFQLATMEKLLPLVRWTPGGKLLSLGSGPGSYELWLLSQGFIEKCVLVDLSEHMLGRAWEIAKSLGLASQVELICADASTVALSEASADMVVSINALHWCKVWKQWVKKALQVAKPGGSIFLSASLGFPQSRINATQFLGVAARGMTIREHGYLLPAVRVGNMQAQSTRYYLAGSKHTKKRG
jgi:ubiquinone/menaquinone biosynthesis C-methylase UbiE